MQAVIMVIYSLLNGLYCGTLSFPKKWFWDMSRYHCEDITPEHMKNASEKGPNNGSPSFTRSLWYAIQETKQTEWVAISRALLEKAQENCDNNIEWNAGGEKIKLMEEFVKSQPSQPEHA